MEDVTEAEASVPTSKESELLGTGMGKDCFVNNLYQKNF